MKNKSKQQPSDRPPGRANPRISINKLGEYLTANAPRRRKIITEQKYPPEVFITGIYNDAFDPIVNFFTRDDLDPEGLHRAIQHLSQKPTFNDHQTSTLQNNIRALQQLLKTVDDLPFEGLTFRAGKERADLLTIGRVSVSVRPELEIVAPQRRGGTKYGLLKLYLGKTHPLDDESGKLIATTVHQYAEQRFGGAASVDQRRCYVLDVFQRRLFVAPKGVIVCRQEIQAACEEIADRWASL